MGDLPFDRVLVYDGTFGRTLTVVEFLEVPLPQRIRWILERQVEFYWGNERVERRRALQAMRAQKIG